MPDKRSFVMYLDYQGPVGLLSDEDAGRLLKALFAYASGDELPPLDGAVAMAFAFVTSQMQRDEEKWERSRQSKAAAGRQGGIKSGASRRANVEIRQEPTEPTEANEANASSASPKQADEADDGVVEVNEANEAVNVDVNVDVDVNVEGEPPPTPSRGEAAAVPYVKIMQLYNETCTSLPHIRIIDGQRKKAVAARWRTYHGLDDFRRLFQRAQASDFLRGGGERNWIADFDWLMKPTNMARVLEGKYDNERRGDHGTDQQHPGQEGTQQPPPPIRLTGFHLAGD